MEEVTFEVATKVQAAFANLAMECYLYNWQPEAQADRISERVEKITKEIFFIPFQDYTEDQLKQLGFSFWDDNLLVAPLWIYEFLPYGLELESIGGGEKVVQKGYKNPQSKHYIDNDIRFGCIAWGIRV